MSFLNEMTNEEAYDWEWRALPRWAKLYSLGIGGPTFMILTWSVFDKEAIGDTLQVVCFCLFMSVSLAQIYCLNRIIRRNAAKSTVSD